MRAGSREKCVFPEQDVDKGGPKQRNIYGFFSVGIMETTKGLFG
jgi:hypothetical protein